MPEPILFPDEQLSLAALEQVDEVCLRFENALREGLLPRLEEYLKGAQGEERVVLLRELLLLDLDYRGRRGEKPTPADYESHLPQEKNLIQAVFQAREQVRTWPDEPDTLDGVGPAWWNEGTVVWNETPEEQDKKTSPDLLEAVPTETYGHENQAKDTITPFPVGPKQPSTFPYPFGDYELLGELGGGGMGIVFRARHRRLDKLVALKLIHFDQGNRPKAVARFQKEMRAAAKVEHPHVVEALHAGEQDGRLFLVMKLLDGIDLHGLVKRTGPLPVADACEAMRQAALGLQAIHEAGLVHRDLKPSNLIMTTQEVIKILDLGLARLTQEEGDDALKTKDGDILGTADYMAPEQQERAAQVTIAADIYSLGCVLFHLLTSRPPFAHYSGTLEKLMAHRLEQPPDLRALRPELPVELVRLVERMLAKKPRERFGAPQEIVQVLKPLAGGAELTGLFRSGEGQLELGFTVTIPPRPSPFRRWWKWLVPGLALGTVIPGLIALFLFLNRPRENRMEPEPGKGPNTGVIPAAPLAVRFLRVKHYASLGGQAEARGEIGVRSFNTRFGDQVRVSSELSEPAYCFLLALNPNGQVPLCLPEDPEKPPEPCERLEFPSGSLAFDLNDEPLGGMQGFVLVASRQPLPPYEVWRQGIPAFPWKRLPPGKDTVWKGDGEKFEGLFPSRDLRGTQSDLEGLGPLVRSVRKLKGMPGIKVVSVLVFPVWPRTGK